MTKTPRNGDLGNKTETFDCHSLTWEHTTRFQLELTMKNI